MSVPNIIANMIRCFLAITCCAEIQNTLYAIQKNLQKSGVQVKWVAPKNIHITLKFLGDIDEESINPICQTIEPITHAASSFAVRLGKLNVFPETQSPRIILVRLQTSDDTLVQLNQTISMRLKILNIPPENKEFTPHATIGRIKSPKNSAFLKKKISEIIVPEIIQTVDQITFYKSTLTPRGAIYNVIKQFPLQNDSF